MERLPNCEPMKPRAWKGFEEFDRLISEGLAAVSLFDVEVELIELKEEI